MLATQLNSLVPSGEMGKGKLVKVNGYSMSKMKDKKYHPLPFPLGAFRGGGWRVMEQAFDCVESQCLERRSRVGRNLGIPWLLLRTGRLKRPQMLLSQRPNMQLLPHINNSNSNKSSNTGHLSTILPFDGITHRPSGNITVYPIEGLSPTKTSNAPPPTNMDDWLQMDDSSPRDL
jgi:hypothetical protein